MSKRARCPHCDRLFDRRVLDDHIVKCRTRAFAKVVTSPPHARTTLVVDGNNVAYHLSYDGVPLVENLLNAIRSLRASGFRPFIVVSAALKHTINKPSVLHDIENVIEATRGTNDDLLIIQEAQERNADIVSNDRFLNWQQKYPWVASRLRRYRLTPSGLILS
ncbi:MAG: hypothetical protein P1Q69_01675 [Candidatus Thorarchaeota archaeon]|nr:hypothetical protein [Candidatus Thorarchaeota archaeon]